MNQKKKKKKNSWGGEQLITTTTATLDDYKGGIPFFVLPRTFQDAVRITRRLGIRYLWIDSLCIIQDSPLDWEIEASRMADIYRNSWLTVSATSSSSAKTGCFRDGQAFEVQAPDDTEDDPIAVLFPEANNLRRNLCLSIRFAIKHPNFSIWADVAANKPFPLLGRAWAYQERLLAPRVLHFGPQELFWECMQQLDCECGAMRWAEGKHMGSYMNRQTTGQIPPKISHYAALHVGTTKKKQLEDTKRKQKLLERWAEMVHEYTRRRLTFPSDRLPAFSGVAAEMIGVLGMRYCAGLWPETMPMGLLWERYHLVMGLSLKDARPAPSWSWASVDAPVTFLQSLAGPYDEWRRPIVSAEVHEIQCVPKGTDERGQVQPKESYIILSAEIVKARLYFERETRLALTKDWIRADKAKAKGLKGPKGFTRGSYLAQPEGSNHDPINFVPDVALCERNGAWIWDCDKTLFCAKIAEVEPSFYWLVMRKIEGEACTYERIGIIHHPDANWETDGKKRRIKII